MIDQNIKFAGDFELVDVKIGGARGIIIDVFNFIVDLNIYEDMSSPTISGNITLNDAQDLVNLLPFIGEEKLLVTFKTPTMDDAQGLVSQAFYIYKMTDRQYTAERAVRYTLHFVSFETVRDLNTKLSRGYEGKIHEVAKNIITTNLATDKQSFIEETRNTIKFVSNYWTPFTCLNFMAKRSLSNVTGSANYVFFENNRGYNFVSIDKLLESDSKTKYIYDNNTRDPSGAGGGSVRDVAETLGRIENYKITTAYDYMNRLQSGMYKSKMILHDMLTKSYEVQILDYEKEFAEHNHLNPFPLTTKGLPAKAAAYQVTRIQSKEGFENYKNDGIKKWFLKHMMQLNEAHAFTMELQVPGRSDLAVGDTIDVFIYRNTPIKSTDMEEDIIDKTFSGRYLITSLCHNLDREKHKLYLTVIKDSLIIDLTKEGTK